MLDPAARQELLALTGHMRRRAERLLGDDAGASDEDAAGPGAPLPLPREGGPLAALAVAFQLYDLDRAALACLLAAEVEPIFRALVRAEQREGGRPWLELGTIADLLGLDREQLPALFELFLAGGKLRELGLALVDEPPDLGDAPLIHLRAKVHRRVLRFCLGADELPQGFSLRRAPQARLEESLLAPAAREDLLARVRYALLSGEPALVALHGVDGVGKKFLAEAIAAELGRALLVIDVRPWDRRLLHQHLADAARETTLAGALPFFDGWDALIDDSLAPRPAAGIDDDEPAPSGAARRPLPPPFARHLERHRGVVFLGAHERYTQLDRLPLTVLHVGVPFPSPAQRGRLYQHALARLGAQLPPDLDPDEIGRKFALDPARIHAAARAATAGAALRRPGAAPVLDRDDLIAASRGQIQHDLASLAARVDKAHRWQDLVIPVEVYESLKELLSYVRHSATVYERQGFAARHSVAPGISALFAGPPGTGKTMCASIVARELAMELFRVDLSRVVSKWIGETEKNLAKVFDEAQRSHAVILFDEADSLFARRTEVKSSIDRYANLEVGYLLQRMEQFSGVTVLTTNFEDTLDPAFKRRITFKMRFEKPDVQARASLWAKMFPAEARLGRDVDFADIGERFELSGGSIRNAAIRAAFLAADEGTPIMQRHVLLAAAREARELGSLVADPRPKLPRVEPGAEPDAPASPMSPVESAPHLVPITRRR